MPSLANQEKLSELKATLSQSENFVVTTYTGMTVEGITNLRGKIREKESRMKIVKNRLFKIALKESSAHGEIAANMDGDLKGPVAVTFAGKDFPGVAKLLVEFSKTNDKVQIKSGIMDGQYLSKEEVIAIATLPSRDELLSIIARGLNTPATQIASGINQIIASLARGIKAVGEKNG